MCAERLERALASLRHRGPDAQGFWLSPDRTVGLGHARLSIIDLQTGDQPIASEDGLIQIVVNGEFYDFERIRLELERRGHRFRTRSDSEIAIHLYEEFGTRALEQLRGEFAFVLWDQRERLLFAARDRFGIKPLHYAWTQDTLWLASEIKALRAAGVPMAWDLESFGQMFSGTFLPDRTSFQGVHQVPPGYYLLATKEQVQVRRYWDFNYPREDELENRPDEEWIEAFGRRFEEAVRLRLRADVPVGCYLSGGLDSCAVLGFAARNLAQPIRAFTLGFDHEHYDETSFAKEMAARAGAEFVPIPIRQAELADHFADTIWHAETLVANAHSAAKFLLSRAVQQAGFKVVLTGEGSDEVLAGYPFFRQDLIDEQGERDPLGGKANRQHLQASNPVSHGILLSDDPAATLPGVQRLLGFAPGYFLACKSIGDKMSTWLRDDGQAELVARDGFRRVLMNVDVLGQLVGRARLNQSLYLSSKTHLPNYMLSVLGDRMEMAHSVEGRLPFLDHPLVELLTQVPPRLKIHELTEKYVLREAARELIPKSVYERQKHPFLSPPSALDPQGAFYRMTQDILRGRAVETLPFVDAGKVRATLDQISGWSAEDKTAWDPPIMLLLSAVILQERFGMQASL